MAPKAADCKNVHNPNLQCKNDFLPYFDGFFLSLLKVYDHKIIFSWPLCIFGSKITKKNVSLIFYPKIPNPPPLRPLCGVGVRDTSYDDICLWNLKHQTGNIFPWLYWAPTPVGLTCLSNSYRLRQKPAHLSFLLLPFFIPQSLVGWTTTYVKSSGFYKFTKVQGSLSTLNSVDIS